MRNKHIIEFFCGLGKHAERIGHTAVLGLGPHHKPYSGDHRHCGTCAFKTVIYHLLAIPIAGTRNFFVPKVIRNTENGVPEFFCAVRKSVNGRFGVIAARRPQRMVMNIMSYFHFRYLSYSVLSFSLSAFPVIISDYQMLFNGFRFFHLIFFSCCDIIYMK